MNVRISRYSIILLSLCFATHLFAISHQPGNRADEQPPTQIAAADTLEPNDSPFDAAILPWIGSGNNTRSGPVNISSGLDLDFYAVELMAGDSLVAVAAAEEAGGTALDPAVSILDSTGVVLASDLLSPGTAAFAAQTAGRYLVLVTDRSLLTGSPFTGAERGYELLLYRYLRRGDVDGSGKLDYRDAFIVFMLAAGLLDPATQESQVLAAADLDGDGLVAGDIDDFRLLISRVEFIPVRDPQAGGKQKNRGIATRLADGSVVGISGQGIPQVMVSGVLADSVLALWTSHTGSTQLPRAAAPTLAQNTPNPFNPSTTIAFSLPDPAHVELAVFSGTGRLTVTLAEGKYPAGAHNIHWDGRDSYGRRVASGVYFYRLTAGRTAVTRKLVVLK